MTTSNTRTPEKLNRSASNPAFESGLFDNEDKERAKSWFLKDEEAVMDFESQLFKACNDDQTMEK